MRTETQERPQASRLFRQIAALLTLPVALALRLPSSRLAFDPDTSYWVGATQAASLLGVHVSRLNQLVAAGRVPFELHADGRRMYRREQVLTVANAREARWR